MKAQRIEPTLRLVRSTQATDVRSTWEQAQASNVSPIRTTVQLQPLQATQGCSLCAGYPCAVPEACQASEAGSRVRPHWLGAHLGSYMLRDLVAFGLALLSIVASVVAMAILAMGR